MKTEAITTPTIEPIATVIVHIFDKFPTVRQPDAEQYPIGLTLYTAKRLAEVNKCELTCLSQPDRGTTFTLSLPSA